MYIIRRIQCAGGYLFHLGIKTNSIVWICAEYSTDMVVPDKIKEFPYVWM